jgi:hypothetical protein
MALESPNQLEAKHRRAECIALALHFSTRIKGWAGSQKVCPCRSDARMRQGWATLLSVPPVKPSTRSASDLEASRSVLHANSQLPIGFVNRFYRVHAVAAEVVCSLLQVLPGSFQGAERVFDLRVIAIGWRWRGQRQQHCDQCKRTQKFLLHNSS